MFESQENNDNPEWAYYSVRSLVARSLGLIDDHVYMFAANIYGPVIYACILPTVFRTTQAKNSCGKNQSVTYGKDRGNEGSIEVFIISLGSNRKGRF